MHIKPFWLSMSTLLLARWALCLAWPQPEGASPPRLQCGISGPKGRSAQPRSFSLTLEVARPPDVVSSVTGVPSGSSFRVVRKGCRPRPAEYRNGPVAAARVRPPPPPPGTMAWLCSPDGHIPEPHIHASRGRRPVSMTRDTARARALAQGSRRTHFRLSPPCPLVCTYPQT